MERGEFTRPFKIAAVWRFRDRGGHGGAGVARSARSECARNGAAQYVKAFEDDPQSPFPATGR
jgi:hypothetical protein